MSRWVLLRGLGRDRRHWEDFPAHLAALDPDAEVLRLDAPGNGERSGEKSPATVAALLEDYREGLRRRGRAGPGRLLALSLGGMVAIEWARRYPSEVECCVLINTSLRGASPFYQRLRPRQYLHLLRVLGSRSPAAQEAAVLEMTSRRREQPLVDRWTAYQREHPVSAANLLRQLLAAARYRAPETPPAVPVLLLASTLDRLVAVDCSRRLARRFAWPLVEHPWAGHDLPLDDPRWLAEQVANWIAPGPER